MPKKVIVIGAGFGGLSAACYLAKAGYSVTVFEKNTQVGGRAMRDIVVNTKDGFVKAAHQNVLQKDSFVFDKGPSWYMMPDVFEEFFADFGKRPSDYYNLVRLDPSYKVFTSTAAYDVPDAPRVYELFEKLEPGSSIQLQKLLTNTKKEYDAIRRSILSKPMLGVGDVLTRPALSLLSKPEMLGSYHARIARYIKHPDLQKILEFMVVFMGGSPHNIPALYTLLTHVDMTLGIWYPMGGMNKLVEAMYRLATELGVEFFLGAEVQLITKSGTSVTSVVTANKTFECDIIVANADYHHVETVLLGMPTERAWAKKTLSPSGLLVYLGVSKKISALRHHNLFFDVDWDGHFAEVFDHKRWSNEPLFYAGVPSVTDALVAPEGHENIFILAPMANGLTPSKELMERTAAACIKRLEKHCGEAIAEHVVYQDIQAHEYFKQTFNAYKGNAFGLAHTLGQSAIWRPKIQHQTYKNMYYVGQYTNPGTGVPIVTLSGKVVAAQIKKDDV